MNNVYADFPMSQEEYNNIPKCKIEMKVTQVKDVPIWDNYTSQLWLNGANWESYFQFYGWNLKEELVWIDVPFFSNESSNNIPKKWDTVYIIANSQTKEIMSVWKENYDWKPGFSICNWTINEQKIIAWKAYIDLYIPVLILITIWILISIFLLKKYKIKIINK